MIPVPYSLGPAIATIGAAVGAFLAFCITLTWFLCHSDARLSTQRSEADKKAQALVEKMLTKNQLKALKDSGILRLRSTYIPGREYRVPRRRGQVQVYEYDHHVGSLCIQPTKWVPDGDVLLMHKLMIEGNEPEYLRTANFFKLQRAF